MQKIVTILVSNMAITHFTALVPHSRSIQHVKSCYRSLCKEFSLRTCS